MKSIDIANGKIFQALNSSQSEADMSVLQKKVYLLQQMGTDLGYNDYIWYTHGPYSPALSDYAHDHIKELTAANLSKYTLKESVSKNIETINSLSQQRHQGTLTDAEWYEVLACILYAKTHRLFSRKKDKESVLSSLLSHKPGYSRDVCEYAYDVLKDAGLI